MRTDHWSPEGRKTLVCVDSYRKGVPVGRLYRGYSEPDTFESFSQFLLKMEEELAIHPWPQADTTHRTFATLPDPPKPAAVCGTGYRGSAATFEVRILFRRNTSWQGLIKWMEPQQEQNFRSVLELILLMDSAMRSGEECRI